VTTFVFGYGSLVDAIDAGGRAAHLHGYRRRWQVAMDNRVDLPGYKYYVDAATGERPEVFVAFLDLDPDPQTAVNGVVFPVDETALQALDARERNYERIEVSVDPPTGGRTFAYRGTAQARERFRRGRQSGTAVIARAYLDVVRATFDQSGPEGASAFARSTDQPPVPIRDLVRVDLPPT
jgi:gamma-glutamylcyclotransferase (GGCT)/AIG2-like uncharacterized protein YtfP